MTGTINTIGYALATLDPALGIGGPHSPILVTPGKKEKKVLDGQDPQTR